MENTYWIDRSDRIIDVSPGWDQFAHRNNGERAVSGEVVGRSLWDFVTGEMTRGWLRTLFNLSRLNKFEVDRPYRCDSPDEKRYMVMHIQPIGGGTLSVSHRILQARPSWPLIHFDFALNDDQPRHQRCSICNRLQVDGRWAEPTDHYYAGKITTQRPIFVRYDVCSICQTLLPGSSGGETTTTLQR